MVPERPGTFLRFSKLEDSVFAEHRSKMSVFSRYRVSDSQQNWPVIPASPHGFTERWPFFYRIACESQMRFASPQPGQGR